MKLKKCLCGLLFVLVGSSGQVSADDTDLYLIPPPNQGRAKVLIIFDNSASMDTIETGVPGGYDPDEEYLPVGSSHSYDERLIYFTVGSGMDESALPVPDSPSESRRFNQLLNGCAVAQEALDTYGRFTGYIREFVFSGNGAGTWQPIKENSGAERNNPIDCWEDIAGDNASNNDVYPNGYPQNSVGNNKNYQPYGGTDAAALENAEKLGFNQGELVTLYTDNYLRWYTRYKNDLLDDVQDLSRLDIAKTAISGVISSMPSVDFGLAVFNMNYDVEGQRDGGRIIAGIRNRTASQKDVLLNTIENLPAETNTPLCETLFEAYQYFSGGPITFGHSDFKYDGNGIHYTPNRPPYDINVEDNGSYLSPMSVCSDIAYIIYITDGVPTLDASANDKITSLVNEANDEGNYFPYTFIGNNGEEISYLPALASYMAHNDILPDTEKFQRVVTHTIGFALEEGSAAEPLLEETARRGNGHYYTANSVADLQQAFSNVLDSITDEGQRFSAPGVAFSNADPTRTLDSAYYALFRPSQGPRWVGNLKKLKVNPSGVLIDANGEAAISKTGGISDSACSLWSSCSPDPDGNDVQEGGAARTIVPDSRTIYSNIKVGGDLAILSKNQASSYAGGDIDLLAHMNMSVAAGTESAELEKAFEWIKGKNVDIDENDEFTSDDYNGVRGDIMGDPMHSQPLAIDFSSGDSTNVRIFVGTNHGMLHAFKDTGSSVEESWAFMPYEFLSNVQELRDNSYANGHSVYGIDGSPVSYLERNESGVITKAWLFFGMRRGGSAYYGFDVTAPDSPILMWRIDSSSAGFANLGQTWSTPVVTKVPGLDTPVVIFGGGYNLGYDANTGSNSDGRNVYLVNAETGKLEHSFGVDGNTALTGIEHSIAGSIATLDSNSDGATDRLYAADLGGNVWRMDMPSENTASWSGFKFASLGGALASSDRRFFYEPVVAQTVFTNVTQVTVTDADGNTSTTTAYQNVPYDAVTLGSGNRASPLDSAVEDMFFVLQDRHVVTKTFGGSGAIVPSPITLTNLYDVTSAAPSSDSENIEFGTKLGWFRNFSIAGEKSLSPSAIIKGDVYFTSFVPAQTTPETADSCLISSTGRLYRYDLHKGGRYNYEFLEVCEDCIPQPPKIITPPKDPDDPDNPDNPDAALIIGRGECDETGENCSGTVALETGLTTNKIYYHVNE
ncbi:MULTISPECIES: pilus assembly protein [unclassified Shewanella]|uniref:pilus assembly protein n=1 Tax=unclassified Shewanella TaxID=196818 RepID=UPI0039B457EF